ncbi:MAG TPA: AMP-binding protein, partial [Pedomonas sp.]|nr:AMP-binding protein [Pedomonas sp.]
MNDEWVAPSREETMARLMKGASRVAGFARDLEYTVADRLEERAGDHADTPFIIFEEETLTFAEVNRRANRVAHAALGAGLKRGDRVALMMLNRPDFLIIWLGLSKIGVVTALINTSAIGPVLAHAIRQVEARVLIVDAELAQAAADLHPNDKPDLVWVQTEAGRAPCMPDGARDFNAATAAAS